MTHEIDLEKITFFFCLQSTMSLNVSAMSWVMCDDDEDEDDDYKTPNPESKKCCVKKISDKSNKNQQQQ